MPAQSIVNATPHPLTLLSPDGQRSVTLPPSGIAPRVSTDETPNDPAVIGVSGWGIPVVRETPGAVTGLPDPQSGVYYVVSRVVAAACPDRNDLLVPHRFVRDAEGNVTGCRALARLA